MQRRVDRAGGTDADDPLHAEDVEQLVGIDADGRHAHAAGHDGYALALKIARIALHAAHVVHQLPIGQVRFGNEFGAQRIARHEHGAGKILRRAGNVGGQIGGGHENPSLRCVGLDDGVAFRRGRPLRTVYHGRACFGNPVFHVWPRLQMCKFLVIRDVVLRIMFVAFRPCDCGSHAAVVRRDGPAASVKERPGALMFRRRQPFSGARLLTACVFLQSYPAGRFRRRERPTADGGALPIL